MNDVLTDTHFAERERFGRLVTFLARQKAPKIIGVGVDERTALVIDAKGVGRLKRVDPDDGSVYLVEPTSGDIEPNRPLGPVRAHVTRLDEPDQFFDFHAWTGTGDSYDITVDGRKRNPYSKNPYTGKPFDSRRAKRTARSG